MFGIGSPTHIRVSSRRKFRRTLSLERLEDRCLLACDYNLTTLLPLGGSGASDARSQRRRRRGGRI